MSITIEQAPNKFAPVFNPMPFVLSSNNLAGNDYFNFLIRVKDSSGNVISQSRYQPRPDNELCLFDVSRHLEKYVSYDVSRLVTPVYGVQRASNVYKEYSIDFIEEYGAVASALASGSPTASGTKYAFNAALEYLTDIAYSGAYTIASGSTNQFLTDMRGANIRLKESDSFDLGIMTDAGATEPVKKIVIKTYNSAGTLIDTYKVTNSYSAGTTSADKFLSILTGAGDLNSHTLSTGSQPIITASVSTYEVYIENNSGNRCSEILTFQIDRRCYREDGVRVHWLNSLGRIDSFNFNFASDISLEVLKSTFNKEVGSFSGAAWSRTSYESGVTNFYNKVTKKIKLRSDYINNKEAEWLQYMVTSPAHWIEYNGQMVSVVIDTSTYQIQTIEKNRLFSVEVDFTFSNNSYRQRL